MSLGHIRRLDANRIFIKDKAGLMAFIGLLGIPFLVGGSILLSLLIRSFLNPAEVEPAMLQWPVRLAVLPSAFGFLGFGVMLTFSRDYILLDGNTGEVLSTKWRMLRKTVTRRPFAEFKAIKAGWKDISQDDAPGACYVAEVWLDGPKALGLVRFDEWDRAVSAAADISRLTGLPVRLDQWKPGDSQGRMSPQTSG